MLKPDTFPYHRVQLWAAINACMLVVSLLLPVSTPESPAPGTVEGFTVTTLLGAGGLILFLRMPGGVIFALIILAGLGSLIALFCTQVRIVFQPEASGSSGLRWFVLLIVSIAAALALTVVTIPRLQATIAVPVCTLCSCGLLYWWADRQQRAAFPT